MSQLFGCRFLQLPVASLSLDCRNNTVCFELKSFQTLREITSINGTFSVF